MATRILELDGSHEAGWSWALEFSDGTRAYYEAHRGGGLWREMRTGGWDGYRNRPIMEMQQVCGTAQFEIPSRTTHAAREYIRRQFCSDVELDLL